MIRLIHVTDLARELGYASAHAGFRAWARKLNITPVPGRSGYYDPELVRRRLNEAQGIGHGEAAGHSAVARRRARRAQPE